MAPIPTSIALPPISSFTRVPQSYTEIKTDQSPEQNEFDMLALASDTHSYILLRLKARLHQLWPKFFRGMQMLLSR